MWESCKAFVLAPWGARILCVIDDAEAERASHDKIETESLFQQASPECSPAVPQDRTTLFFTYGCGYEGMVGASAVAPREGVFERRHLGTTEDSTVYVDELNGIEMAMANFVHQPENQRPTKIVVIFSDCQASIQAVQNPKRSSGQYVLTSIYDSIRYDSRRDPLDPPTRGRSWQ